MIKVQITDTEDPTTNILLEGDLILCSVLNDQPEKGNRNVKSGIIGSCGHKRAIDLITSAARSVAAVLEDCSDCSVEAAAKCTAALLMPSMKRETQEAEEPTTATEITAAEAAGITAALAAAEAASN